MRHPATHPAINRAYWNQQAGDWEAAGERLWASAPNWGIWGLPEQNLRLLRPGGELVFLGHSTLACLCLPGDGALPCTARLQRDAFDLHRLDWTAAVDEPGGVEFNLPISGWLRLFRETGFTVLDFQELRAPAPGPPERFFVTADWAWRWPAEQVWRLRKEGGDDRAGTAT